jgi:hypothetical protein
MKYWVILATFAVAFAQTAPPAKNIVGAVTAVDSAGKQLTVQTDNNGPAYTVKVEDATKFLRLPAGEKDIKKADAAAFSDVSVGDRVLARGPVAEGDNTFPARTIVVMTKSDLAKMHNEEKEAWQKGVVGTVVTVNADSKEIAVKTRGTDAKTVAIDLSGNPGLLRYAPGSYKFDEAKPGTLADIQPGDTVRARGTKNDDGTRLKADEILSGAFETIAATVISVDAEHGIVKVKDLQTKKPMDIKTTGETLERRLPEQMATMMARRMNGGAGGPGGAPGAAAGSAAGGAPAGGPPAGGPPAGARPGGWPGQGGPGGAGGMAGGGGRGNFDLQQVLERMPVMPLSDLKAGDALIISSTKGTDPGSLTAITLVAGVEPFLAAAPRNNSGAVNLGAWSFDGGIPAQ